MVALPRITNDDGILTFLPAAQPEIKLDSVNVILEKINKNIEKMAWSLNAKLGSIAMEMSDFFQYQMANVERAKITEDDQVKKPPVNPSPEEKGRFKLPQIDQSTISGWLTAILTGLGVAFLSSRAGFEKAIQESGIFAYIAKGVAKGVMVATGLSKIVSAIGNNGTIASLGNMIGKIFGAFNSAAKMILPFYAQALALGKGVGKLIPFIAIATTIVDFLRGFSQGENALDGVKKGLMEVAAGWIGWPLNILKNIVGWVAGQLGFENVKTMLGSFDFVQPVKDLVAIAFDTITNVFTFDTERFGEFDYWKQKVFDLLYAPVDIGINFIKKIFSIGDLDNPFRMSDFISSMVGKVNSLMESIYNFDYATAFQQLVESTVAYFTEKFNSVWDTVKTALADGWGVASETIKNKFVSIIDDITKTFSDIFDTIKSYIPSVEDVTKKIVAHLPDWLIPDSYKAPDKRIQELDSLIKEQQDMINRSKSGENVYWGAEDRGQGISQAKIDEANRVKQEILRENNAAPVVAGGATNIVIGGRTTNNASNVNVTNIGGMPSNGRPD